MKIGINLLYLLPCSVGGTESYAAGLLNALAGIDTQDEFVVFVNRESAAWPIPDAANFVRVICPVRASNRGFRYFFEQLRLPRLLAKHRIDIVHSLGYVGPLVTPCASVVTVPDLNFIALKHTMTNRKRIFLRLFSVQSMKRSHRVITISMFSRNEICKKIGIQRENITVTHLGSRSCSTNVYSSGDWLALNRKYGIQEPYLAVIGGGTPNKNLPRLIQAFISLRDEFPHALVIIGRLPPNVDLLTGTLGRFRDRILSIGYVPDEHILPLLGHADLFVLPSLYEGFGLPVLEAQQASVAVACSTAGSLPEVAGDGALYFDPNSIDDMTRAIKRCLENSALRSRLIANGKKNLLRFSWEKTACQTLTVYRDIAHGVSCSSRMSQMIS